MVASKKGERMGMSEMAKLVFPVARIGAALKKGRYAKCVSPTAAVFMTAVLQYCTTELVNVSAKAATVTHKKGPATHKNIKPRHICVAVREDDDLGVLLRNVSIAGGGVQGGIHEALHSKKGSKGSGSVVRDAKKRAKKTTKTKKTKVSKKKSKASPKK